MRAKKEAFAMVLGRVVMGVDLVCVILKRDVE